MYLTFTVTLGLSGQGLCTQLPESVVQFIKEKCPETNIRFDGYIELPDKTAYLPVMPVINENPDEPAKIVQTIPADTDFNKRSVQAVGFRIGGPPRPVINRDTRSRGEPHPACVILPQIMNRGVGQAVNFPVSLYEVTLGG